MKMFFENPYQSFIITFLLQKYCRKDKKLMASF